MLKGKKENKPLITTIIPTYRRPKLLKRAILSVLNQTYLNFQVCIYDNASGDETTEIAKGLSQKDPRVHYYCHSHNTGGFNNLNFGLRHVNSPYFSILSDDDVLLPDFYEKAIKEFKRCPEAGFIATQTIIATDNDVKDISFENYDEKLYRPPEGLLKMSNGGASTWTGILFKKEIIKKAGLLDQKVGSAADSDFLLRVSSVFPYGVLKFPGAIYYINKLSFCFDISLVEFLDGFKKILEKMKNDEVPSDLSREIAYQNFKKHLSRELWRGGLVNLKKKKFSQAKKLSKFLRDNFDENLKSIILCYSAGLCKFSNVFYYSFLALNEIRRFFDIKRKIRNRKLQNAYGIYLEYFDKYLE